MEEVFALANAIQFADFSDEQQVRNVVQKVGKLARKDVPKHVEDELVRSIIKDGKSVNIQDIQNMMGRQK